MNIYLAGGCSGNLSPFFDRYCEIMEADTERNLADREIVEKATKIFLAGSEIRTWILDELEHLERVHILESYYYLRTFEYYMDVCKKCGSFLLDSGAFTFMQKAHGGVDWDAYIEEYAAFINKWGIDLFFELDIDSLVGIERVEQLREKLTSLTGKKPIPVWHKNRGKQYFIDMCRNYPYVGLGGIVIKEIPVKTFESAFPWFINTAHENGTKIHGLGYTRLDNLKKYHFDSVDSTAWLYGNRGGYIFRFNTLTGIMEKHQKSGVRVKSRETAIHNFKEWIKLCNYADKNW